MTSHRHRRHPLHLICLVVQVQNLYLKETIELYGVLEGKECAQARTPLPRVPLSEQSRVQLHLNRLRILVVHGNQQRSLLHREQLHFGLLHSICITQHIVAVLSDACPRNALENGRQQGLPQFFAACLQLRLQNRFDGVLNPLHARMKHSPRSHPCDPVIDSPLKTSTSRFKSFSICAGDGCGMVFNSAALIAISTLLSTLNSTQRTNHAFAEWPRCTLWVDSRNAV